jgi:hypothetical protein
VFHIDHSLVFNSICEGYDNDGTSYVSQPHFGLSVRVKPTPPKVGSWSPPGLLKTQSSIARVKSPCIWTLLASLERSWSVDVQNGLAWTIWTSAAQVMSKRRAESQTSSLTRDHKKSRIDLFPTCALGVRHGVGKLSLKATSLVQTSSRSEVGARSYEVPKSRESKPGQFRDSTLGVPGKRAIRMPLPWANTENTIRSMVVASPESGPWCVMWVRISPWLVPTPNACRMSSNQLVLVLDAGSWPNSLISS